MKQYIVIAGCGYVGNAVSVALQQHKGITLISDDIRMTNRPYIDPQMVDAVIVCVNTPMMPDGSCDTSNVQDVFDLYGDVKYLIKSTVNPVWLKHSSDSHRITYSPEFMRGSNNNADSVQDFLNQEFAIYGGHDCRYWDEIFRAVLPIRDSRYLSLEQAAFAKYVENCFFAAKVTFFNEMHQIFQSLNFEGFDAMTEALSLDHRIGRSHTQVPGPDGKFGYGGHCLPKDLDAMMQFAECSTPILQSVKQTNQKNR